MSINSEHAIIGALLKNPSAIDEIELTIEDFEVESYRMAYQAIIDCVASNQVADVLTVSSRLEKTNSSGQWLHFIGTAAKDCFTVANIAAHAKILKDESRNRKAKEICADVLNTIDKAENTENVVDNAVRLLMDISATRQNYECSLSQALKRSIELIEEAAECTGPVGIPSGVTKLDEVLGGFHDSDLNVIAARPAMGKTAFLLNVANAHCENAGIISAEQPAEQIGIRLIAINGKVDAHHMRNGTMDEFDYAKLSSSVSRLHVNNNIWINDKSGINILEVIRQARKWKHQHDIKALYLDYIQRIKWTDQRIPKWEQVGNVIFSLKELARDLNIPVIALAQVNRDVEKRADKRPGMGDIANSSEIEKEADIVMTLYRDEVYNEDSPDRGIIEIGVCKNRHGPIGLVKSVWVAKHMRIENLSHG